MEDKEFLQDLFSRLIKIESLLENMNENNSLKMQLMEEKLKLQDERIKVANNRISDLEASNKWLGRTSIGALITGAIGLLFIASK